MKVLSIFLWLLLFSAGALKAQPQDDERVTAALEKIASTTPEGRELLRQVQKMRPEVNGCKSTRRLIELVEDYSTKKGDYNILPIGWFASKKTTTKNWKIVFYYKDYLKTYQAAEWEYNPLRGIIYPWEFTNAPLFWTKAGRKKPCGY